MSAARRAIERIVQVPIVMVPIVAVVCTIAPGSAAAAAVTAPAQDERRTSSVDVSPAAALTGQDVTVTLEGWPAGVTNVELCGNGGRRGSSDCDVLGAVAIVVPPSGSVAVQFTVGTPPGGCPCVVRVAQVDGRATAMADIVVTDAPAADGEATAPTERRRLLELADLQIARTHSAAALFGAGADRTLKVTVRNTGTTVVSRPVLSLSFTGDDEPAEVVTALELEPIAPGDALEVEVPFTLPAFSFGGQDVQVRVDGGDDPAIAASHTGTTPWGLVIVAGLGTYLLVMRGVVAVLSRRNRRSDAGSPQPAPIVEASDDATVSTTPPGAPAAAGRVQLVDPHRRYDRAAIDHLLGDADLSERTRSFVRVAIATLDAERGEPETTEAEPFTIDGRTLAGVIASIAALDSLLELETAN